MAASLVEIYNRALTKVGVTDLLATTSDGRAEADVCNLYWADIRDEVLGDYPWPFAKTQAALTEDTVTTREGWEHIYPLPSGCLQPLFLITQETRIALVDSDSRDAYEVTLNDAEDGQILCCDVAEADIQALEYIAQVTDVTVYPPRFVDAVSWRLAVELALALPKSPTRAQKAMEMYRYTADCAFAQQLRGNREDPPLEGSGTRARS